jgi:hypothetical protein
MIFFSGRTSSVVCFACCIQDKAIDTISPTFKIDYLINPRKITAKWVNHGKIGPTTAKWD